MWPNRLPYIAQPQTNLIPMQYPLQNPYLPQQLLSSNQLIANPFAQPKLVYTQPLQQTLQYRPIINPIYYQQGLQYLPYPRPEVSHITTSYVPTIKHSSAYEESRTGAAVTALERNHSARSADDVSLSSQSSNIGSPSLTEPRDDLPLVVSNACDLNDFTYQSVCFYDAFYENCCSLQKESVVVKTTAVAIATETDKAADSVHPEMEVDCNVGDNAKVTTETAKTEPELDSNKDEKLLSDVDPSNQNLEMDMQTQLDVPSPKSDLKEENAAVQSPDVTEDLLLAPTKEELVLEAAATNDLSSCDGVTSVTSSKADSEALLPSIPLQSEDDVLKNTEDVTNQNTDSDLDVSKLSPTCQL